VNWEALLELGEEHSVLGLVARAVQRGNFPNVPADAREKLQNRMRSQHLFTLSLTADLFRILEDFASCGIETLLCKGPVMSQLAYDDPAIRSYVDLDLLVREAEILRATQHMVALGYQGRVGEEAIRKGRVPGEYVFKRPGTLQIVELHTERSFRYYPRPMRIEELFARKRFAALEGRILPSLSLEDELVLNVVHGSKHFWERLMWLADLGAVLARHPEINWPRVSRSAEEVGATRMLHVGLRLAERILGVVVPGTMVKEVHADAAAIELCEKIAKRYPRSVFETPGPRERALFRWEMGGAGIAGAKYLIRLSFSPTEEDWGQEQERSRVWEVLGRPWRLMKKYGGRS
jgi:hypothetical protein